MEKVMQYMWQWRLYGSPDKCLTDGRPMRILHPGLLNQSSGPDFFNAKILLDSTEWAGNVELHVKASDWNRHNHSRDRAYDSVILHVVGENDTYIRRRDGSLIPQLHLPFSAETATRYAMLASQASPLRCRAYIADVAPIYLHDAIDSCAMERLQQKADRVHSLLEQCGGDWRHAAFIVLARAFGFGTNAEPCELMARRLNPAITAKHSDSLFQLEAMLMGVAGLLEHSSLHRDDYLQSLHQEYTFLARKYKLIAIEPTQWKFAASRPAASPVRRLACLAALLSRRLSLPSDLIDAAASLDSLRNFLKVRHEGYWKNHLTFGLPTSRTYAEGIGASAIDLLIINAVAPLCYAYGEQTRHTALTERAQELLLALPGEKNSLTRLWENSASITPANAWESQGMIHLTRNYCEAGNCLRCRIALRSMRNAQML